MLDWLEDSKLPIPVLVVATDSLENVERTVLSRKNSASLWRIGTTHVDSSALAHTLAGLAPPLPGCPRSITRRITIKVERTSARYYVRNGQYDFLESGDIPYTERAALDNMISNVEKMSPFTPADTVTKVRVDWYDKAIREGQRLFNVLIRDTVGPHLLALLQNPHTLTEEVCSLDGDCKQVLTPCPLDMRFEIVFGSTDYAKLFQLPFEHVNHSDFDGVLCSRIPMARRVRMMDSPPQIYAKPFVNRPLRILFMDSDVHGDVSLPKDTVYGKTGTFSFAKLNSSAEELRLLMELKARLGEERIAAVDVIGSASLGVFGQDLKNEVEDKLRYGDYGLFHFCGHSVTADDGLTHLLFHGAQDRPLPVSIRDVAGWMQAGNCKMLVLSSCEGASVLSAIETMRLGAHGMIGFRWVVKDEACLQYFRHFYRSFLEDRRTFSESYQLACEGLRRTSVAEPTWASAVAVVLD
ncbi:CHAT domain-containing protein [Caballeronia sp.]|uniref:CHAT domain-containing protein n=1 Tax=Caballeronia sp. TaxID=1931223 RepID=UPI003C462C93